MNSFKSKLFGLFCVLICWTIFSLIGNLCRNEKVQIKTDNIITVLGRDIPSKIPPPEIFFKKKKFNQIKRTKFEVTYFGFDNFPEAKKAYNYAIEIWSSLITSSVPVKVYAILSPLDSNILGTEDAKEVWDGFYNQPVQNTYYPIALAEKIHGDVISTLSPFDIKTTFNSNFRGWYFGTDGNVPSGKYDFVSVVLHELCHGLGFWSSSNFAYGLGTIGINKGDGLKPIIFDHFIVNSLNQTLLKIIPNISSEMANQLQSNNLFFEGPNATIKSDGNKPKLFAPATWRDGSSISHLDEKSYPPGDSNSLMTPSLAGAEAVHDPGPIVLGIFKDLGWTIVESTIDIKEKFADNDRLISDPFLLQNYPNPCNSSTIIRFYLPRSEYICLKVFSISGKEMTTLRSGIFRDGIHTVELNVNDFPSGMYIYLLKASNFAISKKLIILK